MDPKRYIGNARITDYSFDLANSIRAATTFNTTDLTSLYNYHLSLSVPPNALYPQSNWQPHRLVVMSAIAAKQKDMKKINQCHAMCLKWIIDSDCKCCIAKSHDYHFRYSCEYKVYGWWALCQAMVNLQPLTKYAYKPLFVDYFKWLKPYQTGAITHIEFLHSQLASDVNKPNYKKKFNPAYNDNLMRVYTRLTS